MGAEQPELKVVELQWKIHEPQLELAEATVTTAQLKENMAVYG